MRSALGLSAAPEHVLHLANHLMATASALEGCLQFDRERKTQLVAGSTSLSTPFAHLEGLFEVQESGFVKGTTLEKEFRYPEAHALHISILGQADLPPPSANAVVITDLKKGTTLCTLSRESPHCNLKFVGNAVKIAFKMTSEAPKEYAYSGCRLRIRPKVSSPFRSFSSWRGRAASRACCARWNGRCVICRRRRWLNSTGA